MLRWVTVVGFLGGIGAAAAEPVRMSSDDIKHVMQPGAVLEIDTPLRIAIPVKVDSNGIVSGEAGALGLTLGAMKDRGRWWTENDQLCVKWFRWFDAKARCITLHREGNKVWWHENSGETGTATITEAQTIVAAAPQPPKKRQEPAPRVPVETTAAFEPERIAPVPRPRADLAALSDVETPRASDDANPAMLGAGAATATAAPAMRERPKPRAEDVPVPQRKRQAGAPATAKRQAAAPVTKKTVVAREEAAPAASRAPATLASFRVSGVVDGDILNVRSGPSEFHRAVGAIPARGRGVQIIGACRDWWCPIRHGNLTGWVNRYYLAEDVSQRASARH